MTEPPTVRIAAGTAPKGIDVSDASFTKFDDGCCRQVERRRLPGCVRPGGRMLQGDLVSEQTRDFIAARAYCRANDGTKRRDILPRPLQRLDGRRYHSCDQALSAGMHHPHVRDACQQHGDAIRHRHNERPVMERCDGRIHVTQFSSGCGQIVDDSDISTVDLPHHVPP